MKTLAKVFIILSMIFFFYLIFPIVIGIMALKRIDNPISKDVTIIMSIVTMIFCSLPGGLFMLFADDEVRNDITGNASSSKQSDLDEIKKAKDLYDSGAITEEEYNKIKEKHLNK